MLCQVNVGAGEGLASLQEVIVRVSDEFFDFGVCYSSADLADSLGQQALAAPELLNVAPEQEDTIGALVLR